MSFFPWWLVIAPALGALGAWWVSRRGRLDALERRRLHVIPTPRGGGIGIAAVALLSTLLLANGRTPLSSTWLMAFGLLAAAFAGAWEDRFGLAARWRLALHGLSALLIVLAVGAGWPWWMQLLLVVAIAGFINLVNFMDGINGLVALQAIVMGIALDQLPLALATLGFLPLNFPRARVFLGDVGSYVIGAWMALLWTQCASDSHWPRNPAFALAVLMGLGPLLVDSGWTLLTRIVRGRRWYSAHREHLYQWAVRTGFAHWQVSLVYAALAALLWWLGSLAYGTPRELTVLEPALLVLAWLSLCWWLGKFALLRRHRRQLRAARRRRRSGSSST